MSPLIGDLLVSEKKLKSEVSELGAAFLPSATIFIKVSIIFFLAKTNIIRFPTEVVNNISF